MQTMHCRRDGVVMLLLVACAAVANSQSIIPGVGKIFLHQPIQLLFQFWNAENIGKLLQVLIHSIGWVL